MLLRPLGEFIFWDLVEKDSVARDTLIIDYNTWTLPVIDDTNGWDIFQM